MARIRSVHPGLFTDEAFMACSAFARLLFIGVWTECDDQGVFEWKPITLKMRLLPVDHVDVAALLGELVSLGAVMRFEANGKAYGAVRNFRKWQRPKAPQITHPLSDEAAAFTGYTDLQETADKPERGTALGKMIAERQGSACFYCEREITFYRKKPNSLELDHKIPVSRGGADNIDNLVAACRHCNSLKANLTDTEFRAKFSVAELVARHSANGHSQTPKPNSHPPKTGSGEKPPQMEDGGGSSSSVFEGSNEPSQPGDPAEEADRLERDAQERAKTECFNVDSVWLLETYGKNQDHWRSLIGLWAKKTGGDFVAVSELIEQIRCLDDPPSDPVSWIVKRLSPQTSKTSPDRILQLVRQQDEELERIRAASH